jgi:hypothetical protein
MRVERPLQGLEKRDEDRMQQIEEALCALNWQISNLEERLYLMVTQLQAAELFTAESFLRRGHDPRRASETPHRAGSPWSPRSPHSYAHSQ